MCSSVCGIVMGEQNKTVSILQNAKVPARSVRESSVLAVSWKHGNTASALAAGLSQAHLALGYQPQQSSLWSLLPCSTHTLQSQPLSRLRQCRNVQSSASWLLHLCFFTLPFVVKTKKKGLWDHGRASQLSVLWCCLFPTVKRVTANPT